MKESKESLEFWRQVIEPLIGLCIFLAVIIAGVSFINFILDDITKDLVPYSEYYDTKGISGSHTLAIYDPTGNELQGSFSGSGTFFIFVGAGQVEGSVQTGDVIKFEWVAPDGFTQTIGVPYSMIKWDFDDKYTTPFFEFKFLDTHLNTQVNKNTQIINYNSVFENAEAIIMHTTRARFEAEVLSKIAK